MKKVKAMALVAELVSSMLVPQTAEAKQHSGNYINEDGCLVVWSYETTLFGLIKYNEETHVFCDVVLEP